MSRRWLRNALLVLLALLAIVFVVLVVLVARSDLDPSTKLVSIVGLIAAFAPPVAKIVRLLLTSERGTPSASDLADDLANTFRNEWYEEARVRRLRDPKVLPLTWTTGRMDGKFDEATRQLADRYREVRSGRLMVLGEPGSGKTVLAILLTLGLLNSRSTGSTVPVLLTASSWDPSQESMDDWVIRTLANSNYSGQQDIPRILYRHGLLLPILDGLDEIPESARRSAMRGINDAIGADRPVVVTCRSADYDDVIDDDVPALRQTPVVRVTPVAVADAIAYLRAVPSWPVGTSWEAVFDDLQQRPDSPLAAALSTPLMVSLARTVYQRCGGDPAELLHTQRFDRRHKVEDYLVDRIVDAAYAPDLLPSGEPAQAPTGGWGATEARRWLTFLARYLHQYQERDLAWWRLSDRLLSPWMAPAIGISLGGAVTIAVSVGTAAVISDDTFDWQAALALGFSAGSVVAALGTALWYGNVGSSPGRMAFAVRGSLGRLRRGFATGAALVAILAVPTLLSAAVVILTGSGADSRFSDIYLLVQGLTAAMGLACAVGFAVAAHNWLNALPERSAQASPFSFVQQDRRSSLVGALAAGVIFGLTIWPAFAVAALIGDVLGQGIAGGFGGTGTAEFTEYSAASDVPRILEIGIGVGIPAVSVALLVLLTRAWPRFVLARALLAARGHLPWRLLTFLADARKRDLLRQSGGMYQFRHIRLQERLIAQPGATTTGVRHPAAISTTVVLRRRIMVIAGVVVIASTVVVTLSTFNYLRCDSLLHLGTDIDRVRSFTDSGSLCIGIVPESEWDELGPDRTVFDRLRAGNEDAAQADNEVTIAVLGALRTTDPDLSEVILHQLDGVVLAQRESSRLGQPVRIVLADTGPVDMSEFAVWSRVSSLGGRPGVNMPAVVVLDTAAVEYVSPDYKIPIFSAGFYGDVADRETSLLWQTPAEFDQQIRLSLMARFVRDTLETENALAASDLLYDDELQACTKVDQSVLMHDESTEQISWLLSLVSACNKGPVRLVTTDSSVGDYLQLFSVRDFPSLTVYYPVEDQAPAARRCADVAAQAFPSAAGICTDAGMAVDFSYQTTLNAAGLGSFVIHEIKADRNRWITTESPQVR